jgi:N-acetylneuraminic acid mutarotase
LGIDTTANAWTQKANLGGGIRRYATGFSIGNKGYLGFGDAFTTYQYSDFWEYDPSIDTWTQKSSMTTTGVGQLTSFVINNKGYVTLGNYDAFYGTGTWEYDTTANAWTQKADYPNTGRVQAISFSICNKGYVGAGGAGPTGPYYNDFCAFDPVANIWVQKTNVPSPNRGSCVCFAIDTIGYMGLGESYNLFETDLWKYSPDSINCSLITTGINDVTSAITISIYPNPATTLLNIHQSISSQNQQLIITDLLGTEVYKEMLTGIDNTISISTWSAGIYLYEIRSNTDIARGKFIVN